MRLLHLTDLHVEAGVNELAALWSGVQNALPPSVDFVVISGDIANRADAEEYERALGFLERSILPLVERRRERVVLVPGNHDIQWNLRPGRLLDAPEEVARARADFARRHEASSYRFDEDGNGYEIEPALYQSRFANFQAFVERFYAGALVDAPHRAFRLSTASHEEHWSAHVFPRDDVAFYGLSSCSHTDHCARGARLCAEPLLAAERHMRANPTRLSIAVWHHGLTSERGARDFLTTEELGFIFNAGFSLGIHGHTHADEHDDHWKYFRSHFPVIATGSFGAVPQHLPPGKSNQFSLIELDDARVHWRTFTLQRRVAQWQAIEQPPHSYRLRQRGSGLRRAVSITRARHHVRELSLSAHGIATLQVRLEGLEQVGRLPLARLPAGFTDCESGELIVKRNGQPLNEAADVEQDREGQFWLRDRMPGSYDEVAWTCYFSNGHAVSSTDTLFGLQRAAMQLRPTQDALLYELPFESSRLELRLRLPHPVIEGTPVAVAQQEDASAVWRDLDDAPSSQQLVGTSQTIELTVRSPTLGCRYGFHYELRSNHDRRPPLRDDILGFLEQVLASCRAPRLHELASSSPCLSERLKTGTLAVLKKTLRLPADRAHDDIFMVGRLWSRKARRLLPAYGNFAPETWAASFAYGAGLAGHCFRFGELIAWQQLGSNSEAAQLDASLIYQQPAHDGEYIERPWIIEVPLLLDDKKVPIGTLGLAGPSASLDELAFTILQADTEALAQKRMLTTLSELASVIFWRTTMDLNPRARRNYADFWKSLDLAELA